MRSSMRARYLAPGDQVNFICDHLEGEAKDEIRYRPREDKEDPERILTILQDLYGCSLLLYRRTSFPGSSRRGILYRNTHALCCLMEKVVKSAPTAMPNSDFLLRDQFVEHVLDPALRRELKQIVRRNPRYTLLDVRGEAIQWEREGRAYESRARSYSVPSLCAMQSSKVSGRAAVGSSNNHSGEMAELREMMRKQQEQINQLTEYLRSLQLPPRRPSNSSGPVICRRCQQPGHYARNCDHERVIPQVPSLQSGPGPRESACSQPAEN